ncbi:MAG: hypothetical protein M0Q91_11720 [Methanoregula sp.]|jgi:HSP20 family molecular chaperone IbpA|nr:hypothetical protein [Methanoregula sp.]
MRTGNSKKNGPRTTLEPATTVFDEGKFLRILTELPGIAEEKIKIDLENTSPSITIVASDTSVMYKKVISLPCEVSFCKKRFSEGILELTLEKNKS